jgi:CDP-paratose 2-epimerase
MYGASKLCGELMLAEYDLDWVINRCGVIAGPWQMGKVDQGVFTHWALSAQLGRPLSYIGYGAKGKQVRDLLHVADLVDLLERQLLAPTDYNGHTFNVGGGRSGSLSLLETTRICAELTGHELQVGGVPETRAGDVRCYISDCSALFAHSDWRPSASPRDILSDTFAWISQHKELVADTL